MLLAEEEVVLVAVLPMVAAMAVAVLPMAQAEIMELPAVVLVVEME